MLIMVKGTFKDLQTLNNFIVVDSSHLRHRTLVLSSDVNVTAPDITVASSFHSCLADVTVCDFYFGLSKTSVFKDLTYFVIPQ